MGEILHAWAVAPAAVGACCLAADRARARPPELVASALMLAAMLDAWLTRAVPPIFWTAVLLVGAMALAVWRGPRRAGGGPARVPMAMTLHTALGMVAMGALQVAMIAPSSAPPIAAHGHHATTLGPVLVLGAAAYAVFSATLAARTPARLDRAQIAAMGVSVVLMAFAAL